LIDVSNFEYSSACKAASDRFATASEEEEVVEEELLLEEEEATEAEEDRRDAISEPKDEREERKCILMSVIARV